MELLNPLMLWGSIAIAIPVILHFWHQKKGKVIEWAATQWLIEKNLQQSRGIRLDNLLLLLLRCLLIVLFCFFLSKPLLKWAGAESAAQKIHLVQPNSLIINNFKFELEDALKKGEKIYWIQNTPTLLENINQQPTTTDFNPLILQSCLNKIAPVVNEAQLHLYFINTAKLAEVDNIFVPFRFSLHTVVDSLTKEPKPYLAFANTKVFVNARNELISQHELDKNTQYQPKPVLNSPINALILNQDKAEIQAITASLKALAEVYQLPVSIDTELANDKTYQWVFSNKTIPTQSNGFLPTTLYIISNTNTTPASRLGYQQNIINVPNSFSPQLSARVFNGELPEWLAEVLIKHYVLNPSEPALSQQQLKALFSYTGYKKASDESEFSKILLLVFIVILGIERFIAIRKNA